MFASASAGKAKLVRTISISEYPHACTTGELLENVQSSRAGLSGVAMLLLVSSELMKLIYRNKSSDYQYSR